MGLAIACETRTGDTPQSKRQRQRRRPPGILMTTPESLALLLSYYDAPQVFGNLKCVAIDELHAFAGTKRGDLLALGLARPQSRSPTCRRVGLAATVPDLAWPAVRPSPHNRAARVPQLRQARVRGSGGQTRG